MNKSLSRGPSKIVPVRMPDDEKQAIVDTCDNGESLSEFVRLAAKKEIKRRLAKKKIQPKTL